ncbi:MAG: SDR family oxidoreductase [Anaerolineae bacterium]|nr:SDR family oxidoreductase [Anaerolineae bacterium]
MRLNDRVALITGASQGLGAVTARKFVSEGAFVVLADIDSQGAQALAAQFEAAGRKAMALQVDVTDRAEVQQMVRTTVAEFGHIDILVNNAGALRDRPLLEMSEQDWRLVVDVSLKGSFLCSQAAASFMMEQRYGKIINMSSGSAYGSVNGQANYASAKAGLLGLTRTLAMELGPYNINVNAVAPGAIEIGMSVRTAELKGIAVKEYMDRLAALIPLRRVGQPEEVANVICFLASDEASYIHGEVIHVMGGPRRGF